MQNANVSIQFPDYKLKALTIALEEKGEKPVQELLEDHIERQYQKFVPAQARDFLDKMLGEPMQKQAGPEQEPAASDSEIQRRPGRKRLSLLEQAGPDATPVLDHPKPAQKHEMTMSM